MDSSKTGGFTLIELMVVIAIIGLLASLAVPVYQDYVARSKISEIIRLSNPDRKLAATYHSENGTLPASLESLGIDTSQDRNPYLVGDITAFFDPLDDSFSIVYPVGNLGGSTNPGTLIWRAMLVGGVLRWDCKGGTLELRYRPSVCRP